MAGFQGFYLVYPQYLPFNLATGVAGSTGQCRPAETLASPPDSHPLFAIALPDVRLHCGLPHGLYLVEGPRVVQTFGCDHLKSDWTNTDVSTKRLH